MPRGLPPITHARSFIEVYYDLTIAGVTTFHKSRFYRSSGDITPAVINPLANAYAEAVSFACGSNVNFRTFSATLLGNPTAAPQPIVGAPITGKVAVGGTGQPLESFSWQWTISGRGDDAPAGYALGKARAVIMAGFVLTVAPGTYDIPIALPTVWYNAWDWLNNPSNDVTNIYGQSASFYQNVTVQKNSYAERKHGA